MAFSVNEIKFVQSTISKVVESIQIDLNLKRPNSPLLTVFDIIELA